MWLFFIWIGIYIIFLGKYNSKTVLYLPVLTVLSPISTQLLSFSEYNRGRVLIYYSFLFYVLLISLIELKRNGYKGQKSIFLAIFGFTFLVVIQVFAISSDLVISFKRSLGLIVSLILFIAIYSKYFSRGEIRIALKNIFYSIVIFSVNFVILSGLKIGPSLNEFSYMTGYSEKFLRTGNMYFFSLHGMFIISTLFPLFNGMFRKNTILFFINFLSFFSIIFLAFYTYKRTFLLIPLLGVFLYYFLLVYRSKHKFRDAIIVFAGFFILFYSSRELMNRYIQKRSDANTVQSIEGAGRIMEFALYPKVVESRNNSVFFVLFGTEYLNSAGKFKPLNYLDFEGKRFLHNDFAHLLYGVGIIGLILYLYILYFIFRKSLNYLKIEDPLVKKYAVSSLILVIAIFVSGLSDGILYFLNRGIPFFAIALFLAAARNRVVEIKSY